MATELARLISIVVLYLRWKLHQWSVVGNNPVLLFLWALKEAGLAPFAMSSSLSLSQLLSPYV